MVTMEVVWLDNWKTPGWGQGALERKSEGGNFQSGSEPCCSARRGNTVHKKLPQVSQAKELHLHRMKNQNLWPQQQYTLIDTYVKRGSMVDARYVFDNMPKCSVVAWNMMILGYAKHEEGAIALELFAQMHQEGVHPSDRTFVGVLNACSSLATLEAEKHVDGKFMKTGCVEKGRAVHSRVVKSGSETNIFVANALLDMYMKCGSMEDAQHVFGVMPYPDVVSWTSMILGHAQKDEGALALELYAQMHQKGVLPNDRTFVAALKACSSLTVSEGGKHVGGKFMKVWCLEMGKAIYTQVIKCGFESDVFVRNSLMDLYAKCGSMEDARYVFDDLPHFDVISWNSMILGYAEQEESEEAFKLYTHIKEQGLPANSFTFVSILKACGNIAALETGKELHTEICIVGLETTVIVANTLIDMYAKCGSMVDAQCLFDELPTRDFVTWNALIAGYARQGESELVFCMFESMRQEGMQPNRVTFLGVLSACSHAGLVDKGQRYFEAMSREYAIIPSIEHYTCLIDLLGRAGEVEEAMAMVKNMPFQPDVVSWLAVLGACRKWKRVEIGRHAFDHIVILDNKNAAAYVLMSNIYAQAHMWDDCNKILEMRKNSHAWTKAERSCWTDITGLVHKFEVGDSRHPQSKDIYAKLEDLSVKMKEEGYLPDLGCMLWNMSIDEKEDALCGHSERLAIACALINTPEGTPIRIVKNIQVCDDCHKATALISKIEHRNIICRDTNRFHKYKDGKCSCGDYW